MRAARLSCLSLFIISAIMVICGPSRVTARGFYSSFNAGLANSGYALAANCTYKEDMLTLSARYYFTEQITLVQCGIGPSSFPESAEDLALLAGLSNKYKHGNSATIELGLAYTTIVREKNERICHEKVVGLAYQSQIYWGRIGLTVMGNSNAVRTYTGVLIGFRLGRCN
jgi:hypothetical protein